MFQRILQAFLADLAGPAELAGLRPRLPGLREPQIRVDLGAQSVIPPIL